MYLNFPSALQLFLKHFFFYLRLILMFLSVNLRNKTMLVAYTVIKLQIRINFIENAIILLHKALFLITGVVFMTK